MVRTLMRIALFVLLFTAFGLQVEAQKKGKSTVLQAVEPDDALYDAQIRLTELMYWSQYADSLFERNDANYLFIRNLVQALRLPGAFDFEFDSLRYISKLYTPDRKYRIFSWQVKQDFSWRHFGCILTNEAEPRIIPLIDQSDRFINRDDTSLGPKSWYGAGYYAIVPEIYKVKGITYYTLLGYDPHEPFSQRKMIDILWFDKNGEVHFGAPMLLRPDGLKHRFIIEYAGDVAVQLRYDSFAKKIVFDHLIARNEENKGFGFDDVPDGSFNAFVWKKGKWVFEDNIDLRAPASAPVAAPTPARDQGEQKRQSGLLPED
ncbi:MAG: hypothetical protein ACK417_01075 [Bacteroidia bacterium]